MKMKQYIKILYYLFPPALFGSLKLFRLIIIYVVLGKGSEVRGRTGSVILCLLLLCCPWPG